MYISLTVESLIYVYAVTVNMGNVVIFDLIGGPPVAFLLVPGLAHGLVINSAVK